MQFTAINVFIETEGKQFMARIDPEMAGIFVQMLAAYQSGQPTHTNLTLLPDEIAKHVIEARKALSERIGAAQKGQQ